MINNIAETLEKLYCRKYAEYIVYVIDPDDDEWYNLSLKNEGNVVYQIKTPDLKQLLEQEIIDTSKHLYKIQEGIASCVLIKDGKFFKSFKTIEDYIKFAIKNRKSFDDYYNGLMSEINIAVTNIIQNGMSYKDKPEDAYKTILNNLNVIVKLLADYQYENKIVEKIYYSNYELSLDKEPNFEIDIDYITHIFSLYIKNNYWSNYKNIFVTKDYKIVIPIEHKYICDILTVEEYLQSDYTDFESDISNLSVIRSMDYSMREYLLK